VGGEECKVVNDLLGWILDILDRFEDLSLKVILQDEEINDQEGKMMMF
jgi:hypothetical protein